MTGLRIGSLCSGAGMLDYAVEQVFDGETVWHCEIDEAASRVLVHHWPGVPNHRDLIMTDWSTVEPVDILCGGYPCQPFSSAGQRKGADDERHLWPHFLTAIRHLRPRFVVLENVAGHRTLGFDRVLADMAKTRLYDAHWCSLRASEVGAPHGRERLFVVAHSGDAGSHRETDYARRCESNVAGFDMRGEPSGCCTPASYANCGGCDGHPQCNLEQATELATPLRDNADGRSVADGRPIGRANWGKYATAIERWERLTRVAPEPSEPNRHGKPRLNPAFSEWMMGWPAGWVTDVPGISRNDQLRIIGNGVVPQCAAAAIRSLLALECAA